MGLIIGFLSLPFKVFISIHCLIHVYSIHLQYILAVEYCMWACILSHCYHIFSLGFLSCPFGKKRKILLILVNGSGLKEAIPTLSRLALFHSGTKKPGMSYEGVRQAIMVDRSIGSSLGFIDGTTEWH